MQRACWSRWRRFSCRPRCQNTEPRDGFGVGGHGVQEEEDLVETAAKGRPMEVLGLKHQEGRTRVDAVHVAAEKMWACVHAEVDALRIEVVQSAEVLDAAMRELRAAAMEREREQHGMRAREVELEEEKKEVRARGKEVAALGRELRALEKAQQEMAAAGEHAVDVNQDNKESGDTHTHTHTYVRTHTERGGGWAILRGPSQCPSLCLCVCACARAMSTFCSAADQGEGMTTDGNNGDTQAARDRQGSEEVKSNTSRMGHTWCGNTPTSPVPVASLSVGAGGFGDEPSFMDAFELFLRTVSGKLARVSGGMLNC
jgi:hypothetical protein